MRRSVVLLWNTNASRCVLSVLFSGGRGATEPCLAQWSMTPCSMVSVFNTHHSNRRGRQKLAHRDSTEQSLRNETII